MQILAVNGKVSGYCVHLPVCNLKTVKSTEWEQLLPIIAIFTCKVLVSEFPLQDVADCFKAPVRMIRKPRSILGVPLKLVQK